MLIGKPPTILLNFFTDDSSEVIPINEMRILSLFQKFLSYLKLIYIYP